MKHQSFSRQAVSIITFLFSLFSFSAIANAQDAKAVLDSAVKAMGAENLGNVRWVGNGLNHAFGQAANPNLPWPKFNVKSYDRVVDFDAGGSRTRLVRTQGENPPRGGGQQPIIGEQTQNQLITYRDPWAVQAEMWITPVGFLKGALASGNATVKSETVGGKKYNVVTYTVQGKYKVNGYINEQNLLEKADTLIDTPVLGDTPLEAEYSDYKDFGGLKFPTKIVEKQGGFPILDLTVTQAQRNVYHVINIPAAPTGNADARVIVDEQLVAPGVYYFTGGTHHSAIVEFNNFVVVVDGPLDENRSNAVISEVKKLFIGKPIRYLVNTHQHFDHAGGIRTYAAEGATIITHEINKPYYEKIFATPRTLNPDKLAQSKKKAVIEAVVGGKRVITDGTRTLEIHAAPSGHNDGMLIAYLPKEKVLVEADLYTPAPVSTTAPAAPAAGAAAPAPPPVSPYTLALVETLDKLKLDYDTILPIHGRLVKKEDLMKVVGRAK
jgi:glyoxylase-like metal-dependent hydrolase (beta-lactamase superfamily II)